ncbi:MAG: dihydrodipicolinate synthase family protein [Chloroflexi bacterium]|nr:dihydrodipicolinate synthase family protein [Chloroflexota bacterium]
MACKSQELKNKIVGVVAGLPTLFHEDYSINHQGMRTHVNFLVENGMDVVILSLGISELRSLEFDEVKAVTKTVVEAAAGRVPVIASTAEWWTKQALDFVKYAQDVGADGCIVVPPGNPYTSYSPALHDDAIYRHFATIASATAIGLVVHERNVPGRGGAGAPFSIDLVDRLADIDNVVGLKLEGGDRYYAQTLIRKTRDRLAIIADWGPEDFLFVFALGVPAFITGVGQFAPQVTGQFWQALHSGNLAEARRLANEILTPYYAPVVTMDWVAALKVSMEFAGLPASPMRPPNAQLTPQQRETIHQAMIDTGLLSQEAAGARL